MLAKIVVWTPSRQETLRVAREVLSQTVLFGVNTNQEFLARCLEHGEFVGGRYTTGFVDSFREELLAKKEDMGGGSAIAGSVILKYLAEEERAKTGSFRGIKSKFRVQSLDRSNVKMDHVTISGKTYIVRYLPGRDPTDQVQVWEIPKESPPSDALKTKFLNKPGGTLVHRFYAAITAPPTLKTHSVSVLHASFSRHGPPVGEWLTGQVTLELDGHVRSLSLATESCVGHRDSSPQTLWFSPPSTKLQLRSPLTFAGRLDERSSPGAGDTDSSGVYVAPMPCRILSVLVQDGGRVKVGDGVLVMESMKTEVKVLAKRAGVVRMRVGVGESVAEGGVLCEIIDVDAE
jgi:acetyl/propionyl-CoA carboxylase alpha subunit